MKLTYRNPTIYDEELLKDYISEYLSNGEKDIETSLGLENDDYMDWLRYLLFWKKGVEGFGSIEHYLCFDEDRLVGFMIIRRNLSEETKKKCGDIGYSVRPSERNKGYATKMLADAIEECRKQGIKNIEVGCYKDNIASKRVIEKNGGQLLRESDDYMPGTMSLYYRVGVKENA